MLIHHVTKVIVEMESGKLATCVYVDVAKAFDTVNHRLLLWLL